MNLSIKFFTLRNYPDNSIFHEMKKYILILLSLLIWGCQKNFNSVIDPPEPVAKKISVMTDNSFSYSISDSSIQISIGLSDTTNVNSVSCDIFGPGNSTVNASPVSLNFTNVLGVPNTSLAIKGLFYTTNFPMSQNFPSGNYQIKYYLTDYNGNTSTIAMNSFSYNNGLNSPAPVISSLVCPDTAKIGKVNDTLFVSVFVQDSIGLWDVESVFFNSFIPPNGQASSTNPIPLHDDGTFGDKVAGDGIYSSYIILPPFGVTKGTYRFEFQAKSFNGKLSNKIIHNIVIE